MVWDRSTWALIPLVGDGHVARPLAPRAEFGFRAARARPDRLNSSGIDTLAQISTDTLSHVTGQSFLACRLEHTLNRSHPKENGIIWVDEHQRQGHRGAADLRRKMIHPNKVHVL